MKRICSRRNALAVGLVLGHMVGSSNVVAQAPRRKQPMGRLVAASPNAKMTAELGRFKQRHADAKVLWDRATGLPGKITQLERKIAPALAAHTADAVVRKFVAANRAFLGIDAADLVRRSTVQRRGRVTVKYQQTHDGIPVEGAEAGCIATVDGRLLQVTSNCAPVGQFSTTPKFSRDQAVLLARRVLRNLGPSAAVDKVEKVIRRESARGQIRYRLAYKVYLTTTAKDQPPHKLVVFDANTGRPITIGDRFPATIRGTVRGEICPRLITDTREIRAMPNLSVLGSRPGRTTVQLIPTRSDGQYMLPAGPGTWTVQSPLSGLYAAVTSVANTNVAHEGTLANGGTHDWTWRSVDGDDLEQLNVYYHINRVHDELYGRMLGYRWTNAWTGGRQFIAETGYAMNNAYSGSPMTFGTGRYSLNAEVIYHECTHNVLYSLFGNAWIGFVSGDAVANSHEAYAFDEGFSDFFACSLLGEPTHGSRNLANAMIYPDEYDVETGQGLEGHSGGQIIGGAAWDLRLLMQERLGDERGAQEATNLVFDSLTTLATYPRPYRFSYPGTSNFLEALLLTDDDNDSLEDGTPNDREIFQAFRVHRMLPVDVYVRDRIGDTAHVPSNPRGEPFWQSPDIDVDLPSDTADPRRLRVTTDVRVTVHNRGYLPTGLVTVELYTADVEEGTRWPDDWSLIGTAEVRDVDPLSNRLSPPITWRPRTNGEWALMARLRCDDDPVSELGSVPEENNVAQRNVTVRGFMPGVRAEVGFRLRLDDRFSRMRRALEIVKERFPPDLDLRLDWIDPRTKRPVPQPGPAATRTMTIPATALSPVKLAKPSASMRAKADRALADLDRALAKRKAVKRLSAPKSAPKPAAAPQTVAVRSFSLDKGPVDDLLVKLSFQVPKNAKPGETYVFHVVESVEGKAVGGITYIGHVMPK